MNNNQVRIEYSWLAEETRFLVASFDFDMSEQAWLDHDRLMDACECLDRIVDGSPDETRSNRAQEIIAALRSKSHHGYDFDSELQRHCEQLVDIFERYEDPEFFIGRAERIFAIAEELRVITDSASYIERVCEEGRCFLEMFLPIFAQSATPEFMYFFPSVAEVGNLVDKLVDARADHRRGEMLIYPGFGHHGRLLKEIAWRGREAFRRFPKSSRLFLWAIRFFDPRRHVSAF